MQIPENPTGSLVMPTGKCLAYGLVVSTGLVATSSSLFEGLVVYFTKYTVTLGFASGI